MSFAVDKFGDTFAWGQNKHNQLLIEDQKQTIINSDVPTRVKFPDYFKKSSSINVNFNNSQGITMYEAKRPVKSVASETQ